MFEKKSTYSREELIQCGEGKLFDAGIPRLPLPPMLMFDRFTEVSESGGVHDKGVIKAELDITKDLWFFECHFRGDPVMPGCLGLDAVWQMLGFYLGWLGNVGKGRALGCGEVKFTDQILPDSELVEYQVDIKRIIARKLVMGVADATVSCGGKVLYNCKDLKVALFNDESTEGLS
ncbi:MAG: bifunctional 3-hydroxydecanoyl-ACP dehydratase/trans-2-decenoyl-ACP isomerase [Bdellovibrionales bacterium]|nr:bifunctional 3-hydroxydecanoyl-ACP dehydratase/trans-2-decenoyl-ACP isomerase [Bdellovibrionales bacterium]